ELRRNAGEVLRLRHRAQLLGVADEVRIEHLLLVPEGLVSEDDVLLRDLRSAVLLNRADRAGSVFFPEIGWPQGDCHDDDRDERSEPDENWGFAAIFSAHEGLLAAV